MATTRWHMRLTSSTMVAFWFTHTQNAGETAASMCVDAPVLARDIATWCTCDTHPAVDDSYHMNRFKMNTRLTVFVG